MNTLYEKTVRELLRYALKRLVMLGAKLLGFKSFCLVLATVLLVRGIISEDIWLYVLITVVCSASGLRIADAWSFTLPRTGGKRTRYPAAAGTVMEMEEGTDEYRKTYDHNLHTADRRARSGSSVRDAVSSGKRRIRELFAGRSDISASGNSRSDTATERGSTNNRGTGSKNTDSADRSSGNGDRSAGTHS
jgi:hypothetical protein